MNDPGCIHGEFGCARCYGALLLLGGSAAGLDGGAHAGGLDAEGLGERGDSCHAGHLDGAVPQVQQRPGAQLRALGELAEGKPPGVDQGVDGLGRAGHAGALVAETSEKFHGHILDFVRKTADNCDMARGDLGHVEEAPTAANFPREAAAGAEPEPARNQPMTTTSTVTATPEQLRAARELLALFNDPKHRDYLRGDSTAIERARLALAAEIEAQDADGIDDQSHEARSVLGLLCAECHKVLDGWQVEEGICSDACGRAYHFSAPDDDLWGAY